LVHEIEQRGDVVTDARSARLLKQADFQQTWGSPRAEEPGFRRAFTEGVRGLNFMANILTLPVGQGAPAHVYGGDVIVVALTGSVEFVVGSGDERVRYIVEPTDMLFLPAGLRYEYRNASAGESSFLSIAGRVDEWPATASYEGLEEDIVVHP
jgi:uncharacterized RmlC-like cupin family protein